MVKMNKAFNYLVVGLIVIVAYLSLSLIFYTDIWKQIRDADSPSQLTAQGETHIYEFAAEVIRDNIKSGKSPYEPTNKVFYPTGWNFAPDDVAPINGFYFLLLRPFLSIHQSFMLIVVTSVLLSNLSMFFLLRLLKLDKLVSFTGGAIYGFTPFVSYRIWGHPTYVALYLFAIPAILFLLLTKEKKLYLKTTYSSLLGLSLAVVVLTNLYFTVMWVVLVLLLTFFSIAYEKEKLKQIINSNYKFFSLTFVSGLLFLSPWLIKTYQWFSINGYQKKSLVTDSISLSADAVGLFWPTRNIFYFNFINKLGDHFRYYQWLENFIYPGVIILVTSVLYLFIKNKLPSYLKILFATGVAIFIITLGPRLTILGKTTGITLPYSFLYKIPLLQMARAPSRFIVPVIFLMSIIASFVLSYYLKKLKFSKRIIVFLLLLIIFMVDSTFLQARTDIYPLPSNIYRYLSVHRHGPLLEIPFVIRDGIKSFGFANSVWTVRTEVYHDRPIFSLYAGRVPEKAFLSFQDDPLFGPIGKLIDIKTISSKEILKSFNYETAKKTIIKHNISFALVKKYERYSTDVESILAGLNFEPIMNDNGYALWQRKR